MRKLILIFALLLAVNINAQVAVQSAKAVLVNDASSQKDRPTDVRLLYPDLDKQAIEYTQNHPEYSTTGRLNKPDWTFTVGSTYTWYAKNLSTGNFYQVSSTCRSVGAHCYIFVEDSNWGTRVTQTAVNAVQNAFDYSTPANSSKGIYQTDVDTFGNPPDVDGDSKIIILILDIKDSYAKVGDAYTVGYFHGWNELPKASNYGSNEAEIYYLDCNPLDLTTSNGQTLGMSTAAHEFQHMIHWNYQRGNQTQFLNEGCSLVAELINGYDFREQTSFASDTPQGLLVWRSGNDVLKDYSRAARFMLYYYDQFGMDFLKKFVQSSYAGITGIDDALSKLIISTSRRFADILPDWYLANAVDNTTFNPKWGYTKVTGMPKPQGAVYYSANVNSYSANVPYMGAQIITHKGSLSLNSTFGAGNSTYHKIKAIKFGSGNPVVDENVPLNSTYSVPSLSGTYSSIQYLILNSSITTDYPIQYSSTGTNPAGYELSYSVNSAAGSFNWATGDTVAVYFDPINMGRIDSLKIQFSTSGSITGGIWEYTGSPSPTPLGKKLLTNMQANPVIISSAKNEWTKIDLRSSNISSNKQFAVAFPVVTGNPRVLVSEYPSTTSYHSYTYLGTDASSGVPGWYYVNKDASTIYVYMIKAYISVGTVGNEKVIEMLPSNYSLSQNYPNPFNPSTKIKFTLPEAAKVAVRIYDMLGREIKTIINTEQTAGSHEITWNGDNEAGQKVASGVYFYAISTNKFVQTKKMILLK